MPIINRYSLVFELITQKSFNPSHCFTYICDCHAEQAFPVVVNLGHSLALLKLLACLPDLVGHLMGMINVSMTRKPSNNHLETYSDYFRTMQHQYN